MVDKELLSLLTPEQIEEYLKRIAQQDREVWKATYEYNKNYLPPVVYEPLTTLRKMGMPLDKTKMLIKIRNHKHTPLREDGVSFECIGIYL
jgi:hypothetical protein